MSKLKVAFLLLWSLNCFVSKLHGQTSANDTICVSTKHTEVFVLNNDVVTTPFFSIEIIESPTHGTSIIPNTADRIWYTASTTEHLPTRGGVDSLKYRLTDGANVTEAKVYFNLGKFDLPISPISSVCATDPNKIISNPVSFSGTWIYDPLEITIDSPNLSNSSMSLISSTTSIAWQDDQYNCPETKFNFSSNSLEVELSGNGHTLCENEKVVLNNVYGQPLNSSPTGLSITHQWLVNDVVLSGDTLEPSEFGQGKFNFETQFTSVGCSTSLKDSIEIVTVNGNYVLDSVYCADNSTIDLASSLEVPLVDPNSTSLWYLNGLLFNGMFSLNTPGTYDIDHVLTTLHCKDSIRKQVTIYENTDSDFINPEPFYCDESDSLEFETTFDPVTTNGIWLTNKETIPSEYLNFSSLNGGQTDSIIHITGLSICRDTTIKTFFLDTLQEISIKTLNSFYCNDDSAPITLSTLLPVPNNGTFSLQSTPITVLDFVNLFEKDSIKYDVESTNGACRDSIYLPFTVDTLAEPNFDNLDNFYCNDEATDITLADLNPTPANGNFLLNNTISSDISFLNLSGDYTLEYAVASPNNICKDTVDQTFTVDTLAEPNFDNLDNFYCNDEANDITLADLNPTPANGNFLLNNIVSTDISFLNLSEDYTLEYAVASPNNICKDTVDQTFTVDTLAEPNFDNLDNFYCNDEATDITLANLNPTPPNGNFLLNNIVSTDIDFLNLSGNYSLEYAVASPNNICKDTLEQIFTVDTLAEPNFDNLDDFYCNDEATDITLADLNPTPASGIFLLNNIVSTDIDFLNLSGNYSLEYVVASTNDICKDTIDQTFTVDTLAEPNFDNLDDFYCNDEETDITLADLNPTPASGNFLLNNIVSTDIDFLNLSGDYTLEYVVASPNNICKDTIDQTFTVDTLAEPNFDNLDDFYCNDEETDITLADLNPTPASGNFLLNDIISTDISFLNLSGDYSLEYAVASPNDICKDTVDQTFTVDTLAEPNFDELNPSYCDADSKLLLNSLNPSPTTQIDFFQWQVATSTILDSISFENLFGNNVLSYTVFNGACIDTFSRSFNVDTLGTPTFSTLSARYCDDENTISFDELFPFPDTLITNSNWTINNESITELNFENLFNNQTLKYIVENGTCQDSISKSFFVDTLSDIYFDLLENRYCNTSLSIDLNDLNPSPLGTDSISTKWKLNNIDFTETQIDLSTNIGINSLEYLTQKGACSDTLSQELIIDLFSSSKWVMDTLLCSDENESIPLADLSNAVGSSWFVESTGLINIIDTIPLKDSATYFIKHFTENGICSDSSMKTLKVFLAPNRQTFDSIVDPLCSAIQNVNLDNRVTSKDVFTTNWKVSRDVADYIVPSGIMDITKLDASHTNILEYTITNEQSLTTDKCSYSGSNVLNITEPSDTIIIDTISYSLGSDSLIIIPYDSEKQLGVSNVPTQLVLLPNSTNDSLIVKHFRFRFENKVNDQSIKLISKDELSCEIPTIYNIDFEKRIELDAGQDKTVQLDEDCIFLEAKEPNFGGGQWTADPEENVIILDSNSPTTQVCFTNKEDTKLSWNIQSKNQDTTGTITLSFQPLQISEGFSPNGDGLNDKFEILGLSENTTIKVTIFNRWGQIVFKTHDYNIEQWDGTNSKGEMLPNDSYIYNLDIEEVSQETGTVILRK